MPTTRIAIHRRMKFTPRAIDIFRRMMADDCGDDEYDMLGHELRRELKLGLAEGYPPIVLPGFEPLRPANTPAGRWQREDGPKVFRELCTAAGINCDCADQ